jgi:uncharacterized protein (DUF427 family)
MIMVRAVWNGQVIAESDKTIVVEGNHYFPPESVNMEFFQKSRKHTVCLWKGEASYYTIKIDGKINPDAAWYYPRPKEAARQIQGYVAFWRGVQIKS